MKAGSRKGILGRGRLRTKERLAWCYAERKAVTWVPGGDGTGKRSVSSHTWLEGDEACREECV